MTKRQRHSFYKHLLKSVCKDPDTDSGMCFYIDHLVRFDNKCPELFYVYDKGQFKAKLPELYSKKPDDDWYGEYWFPLTAKGWQTRIRLIEECIEETK